MGLSATIMNVIGAFVATPILVRYLGDERFGAFRVGSDIFGYLALLELGLGGALLPILARAHAQGDRTRLEGSVSAAIRVYSGIAVATLVIGAIVGIFLGSLITLPTPEATDLRIGWFLALGSALVVPLAPFRALAEARQRSYWVTGLLIVQYVVTTLLAVALAITGFGIKGQFFAFATGVMLFHILLAVSGLVADPGILHATAHRPPEDLRRAIWELNGPTLLFNLCGRVSFLTDNIVVSSLLGASVVAPLVLTQRLASLAQNQLQGMGNATWAALAELHLQGNVKGFNDRLLDVTQLVGVIGVAGLVPIAAYNDHFVSIWVGEGHYGGSAVTLVAVLNAYMMSIQSLWLWCFTGTGQVKRVIPLMLASTLVNLVLSVVLTRGLGMVGASVGTLLALSCTSAWYLPVLMRSTFNSSTVALVRAALEPIAWSIPYGICVWSVSRTHTPWGYPGLALEVSLSALVFLVLFWFLAVRRDRRAEILDRVLLMLGRRATS